VDEDVRLTAGKAWSFRQWVERDAQARFLRLAGRLEGIGTPASLVAKAREASEDEGRHADFCAELAERYDHPLRPSEGEPREIAPNELGPRQKVLYEVAASCLAESESSVMLVTLIQHARDERMRRLLRELSKDEVAHARLGWAVLGSHRHADDLSFLARWIPWMLTTTAGDSFRKDSAGPEEPSLVEHGVLPYSMRRKVFVEALEDVIFPGLDALGIDATASRAWLAKLLSSSGT
jgi:Rubrerythrin